jgi:hypothetical protein
MGGKHAPTNAPAVTAKGSTWPFIDRKPPQDFPISDRALAWIDGRNLAIEYRWAEGRNERYAENAAEFVRLKVDVIVTSGTPPNQLRYHPLA